MVQYKNKWVYHKGCFLWGEYSGTVFFLCRKNKIKKFLLFFSLFCCVAADSRLQNDTFTGFLHPTGRRHENADLDQAGLASMACFFFSYMDAERMMFATGDKPVSAKRLQTVREEEGQLMSCSAFTQTWCGRSKSAEGVQAVSKPAVSALRPQIHFSQTELSCSSGWFVTCEQKAVLLRQSSIFRHAVEDSSLCYEVCWSVKLCYLSLVQNQHSGRQEHREEWSDSLLAFSTLNLKPGQNSSFLCTWCNPWWCWVCERW